MRNIASNSIIEIPISTNDVNGASITMTALLSNVEIYKNNSVTKRTSTSGITLSVNFNGVIGTHLIQIDTSDNTDAGFYASGNNYKIMLNSVTIDTQTVSAFVGEFAIENEFMRGTDNAALAVTIGTPTDTDTSTDIANVQTAISSIGTGGSGALAFEMTSDNVLAPLKGITFLGVQTFGTFANTQINPINYHNITADVNGDIDIIYKTNIGSNREMINVLFEGYLNSNNDFAEFFLYNFSASAWEVQPSYTLNGVNGVINTVEPVIRALSRHTGTGAELGDVYIRIKVTLIAGADLFVGTLFSSGVDATASSGYGGVITIDTSGNGTPGSDPRINGTIDNPVDNMADLDLLIAAKNFDTVCVRGSSSISLTPNSNGLKFNGHAYTVNLNGQDITGASFNGAFINGIGTGAGNVPQINSCRLQTTTLPPVMARECGFLPAMTLTAGQGGVYTFFEGHNMDSFTNSMIFDFNKVVNTIIAVKLNLKPCSGGYTLKNMKASDEASLDGFGHLIIDASNTSGGSIRVSPLISITDNVPGGFTGTITKGDVTNSLQTLTDLLGATADITGATSGTSFTISNVKDSKGNSISLATDIFAGQIFKATTRAGQALSNVVDQVVMVQSITVGGVVTVKIDDIAGAGFASTPNTTTTSVRIL